MKSFMPVCVDVAQARVVVVGGGKVALQKLRTISGYAAHPHVYAREILPEIKELKVAWIECTYDPALLHDALLVYACTDDRELNHRICEDGRRAGALVCAADDPSNCDFVSPAVYRSGEMSVAVSSNGLNARKTVAWRNAIRQFVIDHLETKDDAG